MTFGLTALAADPRFPLSKLPKLTFAESLAEEAQW
jgi:hypothetical protein